VVVGLREFLEGEARHLGHHVVDRRLEGSRSRAAGDVVLELVEGVADCELRRDFAMGKPVAFEASAEERDTRGFISMMTMRRRRD
jgi:hypothetical protein